MTLFLNSPDTDKLSVEWKTGAINKGRRRASSRVQFVRRCIIVYNIRIGNDINGIIIKGRWGNRIRGLQHGYVKWNLKRSSASIT